MAVCSKCDKIFKKKTKYGTVCDDCKLVVKTCVDCGELIHTSPNGQRVRCIRCRDEYKRKMKKIYQQRWLSKRKVGL